MGQRNCCYSDKAREKVNKICRSRPGHLRQLDHANCYDECRVYYNRGDARKRNYRRQGQHKADQGVNNLVRMLIHFPSNIYSGWMESRNKKDQNEDNQCSSRQPNPVAERFRRKAQPGYRAPLPVNTTEIVLTAISRSNQIEKFFT